MARPGRSARSCRGVVCDHGGWMAKGGDDALSRPGRATGETAAAAAGVRPRRVGGGRGRAPAIPGLRGTVDAHKLTETPRPPLNPDEALALAYASSKDFRAERDPPAASGAPSRRRPGCPRLGAHYAQRSSTGRSSARSGRSGCRSSSALICSPSSSAFCSARSSAGVRDDRRGRAIRRRPRLDRGGASGPYGGGSNLPRSEGRLLLVLAPNPQQRNREQQLSLLVLRTRRPS